MKAAVIIIAHVSVCRLRVNWSRLGLGPSCGSGSCLFYMDPIFLKLVVLYGEWQGSKRARPAMREVPNPCLCVYSYRFAKPVTWPNSQEMKVAESLLTPLSNDWCRHWVGSGGGISQGVVSASPLLNNLSQGLSLPAFFGRKKFIIMNLYFPIWEIQLVVLSLKKSWVGILPNKLLS